MTENKKYIVLLGDGMADLPIPSLGGKTILEHSRTPNMDRMAAGGINGLTQTVPEGMSPGSDTANLSIFGYDPAKYYSGRAPLEAINMGIEMGPEDVAFRCNMVNASGMTMNDFTASHIDSRLSKIIMEELSANLEVDDIEFYSGVSYRNLMVWRNSPYISVASTTPPHDIQGLKTEEYLPTGEGSQILRSLMNTSQGIIAASSKIKKALKNYQGNPDSIWIWGGGRKPQMETFQKKFGLSGHTISAVDLIHGIGKAAGLTPLEVEGATGYIDTNYRGKTKALAQGLKDSDYVFLHVEAPDESGHEGSIEHKIKSVEDFDSWIVGPVLEELEKYPSYTVLLMPDHPTPIKFKTHTSDPVPFCIYSNDSFIEEHTKYSAPAYSEKDAEKTGLFIEHAHDLIGIMIKGTI